MVEFAMFLPWYLLLFIGAFDWGFFAHGLISTESAARVGALSNQLSFTSATYNQTSAYSASFGRPSTSVRASPPAQACR